MFEEPMIRAHIRSRPAAIVASFVDEALCLHTFTQRSSHAQTRSECFASTAACGSMLALAASNAAMNTNENAARCRIQCSVVPHSRCRTLASVSRFARNRTVTVQYIRSSFSIRRAVLTFYFLNCPFVLPEFRSNTSIS